MLRCGTGGVCYWTTADVRLLDNQGYRPHLRLWSPWFWAPYWACLNDKGTNKRKITKAEREAREADRLATKAIRKVDKLAGDHLSDGVERVLGDMLGWGVNTGLDALSVAGGPLSIVGTVGSMASNWFGFAQHIGRSHQPGCKPMGAQQRIGVGSGLGPRANRTFYRSTKLPRVIKGTAPAAHMAVPLAPNEQIKSFSEGADLETSLGHCHFETCRVFIGQLPVAANYGDLIASFPLDLLTGILSTTRGAYLASAWDMVCWMGASFVYSPMCAATTSGGMVAVFSDDPTRSIAETPSDRRVRDAFGYGDDMLASNLWSTGMAFVIHPDPERKYQNFKTATSDEGLKLGGAGRFELICSSTWSGSDSPGLMWMELDLCFLNEVPIATNGPSDHKSSALVTARWTGTTSANVASPQGGYFPISDWITDVNATGRLIPPLGTSRDTENSFNGVFSKCSASELPSQFGTSPFLRGGLSDVGLVPYDNGAVDIFRFRLPAGHYTLSCEWETVHQSGTAPVLTNNASLTYGAATVTPTTNSTSTTSFQQLAYVWDFTVEAGSNTDFQLQGPQVGAVSALAGQHFAFEAVLSRRDATILDNPLIDAVAAAALLRCAAAGGDDNVDMQLHQYVVDTCEQIPLEDRLGVKRARRAIDAQREELLGNIMDKIRDGVEFNRSDIERLLRAVAASSDYSQV